MIRALSCLALVTPLVLAACGGDPGEVEGGVDAGVEDIDAPDLCRDVDCGDGGDACNASVCNPATGACEVVPANDGATCDDGDGCTGADACSGGVCIGQDQCPLALSDFAEASFAIGQADLQSGLVNAGAGNATVVPDGFRLPLDAPVAIGGRFYAVDSGNRRLLIFDEVPAGFAAVPDNVLGAPDLFTVGSTGPNGGGIRGFARGLCTDGTRLGIADPQGNRVQLFDTAPSGDALPDVVVGQPDFATTAPGTSASVMHEPFACAMAAGRLAVVDTFNNRVLLWNSIPTANGTSADVVLGQADFTGNAANAGGAVTASTVRRPQNVWTDGVRLVVSDSANNRILIWNTWPTENAAPADLVLGQPDFSSADGGGGASGLRTPAQVTVAGVQMIIADTNNHRVLIHDAWPTTDNRPADRVLGQSDFDHVASQDDDQDGVRDAAESARTFESPSGVVMIGSRLFVTDTLNQRILGF